MISIIALLISILLPSLKRAREQAKQVKCTANLKQITTGSTTYRAEYNGWFAGSPATTGQQLFPRGGAAPPAEAVNTPGEVVQVWDWAGPIAAQGVALHWHRAERWRATVITGMFECPNNQFIAAPWPGGTGPEGGHDGFGPQRMVSYTTMRAMMTRHDKNADPSDPPQVYVQYFHGQVGGNEYPPESYEPRIERIVSPSEKIFLADGARFTTEEGVIDYDYDWKATAGGGFASEAPTAPDEYHRSYKRSAVAPSFAKYAYRHANGGILGLVTAYFDGHAEWMSEAQSRWPAPWWPKSTELPRSEMNEETMNLTRPYQNRRGRYLVRR